MTTIINANTSAGLTQTADTSGIVKLQSNGVTTNALAWVNFNGTGTVAIRSSYNVSSITDNGTGDYTVNFTNALSDANYAPVASTSPSYGSQWGYSPSLNTTTSSATEVAPTTTALRVFQYSPTGAYDPKYFSVVVFGN